MAIFDNLFGVQPEYFSGLLGADETEKLRKQAMTTGLVNSAIALIAQPRNQRFGSALPYIGRALMAGQQAGQGVYNSALQGLEMQQKIAELKRQQEQRKAFDEASRNLYTTIPAKYKETQVSGGGFLPGVQQGEAPNFNVSQQYAQPTIERTMIAPERRELNTEALMNIAMSGDPRTTGLFSGLKTIKEFTTPEKEDYITLSPGQIAVSPTSGKIFKGNEKEKEQWSDPFNLNGQVVQENRNTGEIRQAVTQPASTRVDVNTSGESEYQKKLGTKLAERDVLIIEAGQGAMRQYENAQRVKNLLIQNPITGAGAGEITQLNNLLSSAGLINPNRGITTEILMSNLAETTLQNIKTSGLGAGSGFTENDRKFLERAKAGEITMRAESLQYLNELNERSALLAMENYNKLVDRIPQENRSYYGLNPVLIPSKTPKGRLRLKENKATNPD